MKDIQGIQDKVEDFFAFNNAYLENAETLNKEDLEFYNGFMIASAMAFLKQHDLLDKFEDFRERLETYITMYMEQTE